jgi:hypothetical protein
MGPVCLNAYRVFLLLFAIWGGSGLFESIGTHSAWWADPVAYAAVPPRPGQINPWPPLTVLLLVSLLASAATIWRYRGPGRRKALTTLTAAALTLAATFAYFVPELNRMFGAGAFSDAQLVAHSRAWIGLNALRIAIVLAAVYWGFVALGRFVHRVD